MHNYRPAASADIQLQVCVQEAFRYGILRDPYLIYFKKIINNRINANVCVKKKNLTIKKQYICSVLTLYQNTLFFLIPCF